MRRIRMLFLPAALTAVGACRSIIEPDPAQSATHRLAVGEVTTCALDATGVAYCWGGNTDRWEFGENPSQLPSSSSPIAVPVPSLLSLSDGASSHMCGVTVDRKISCWGRGDFGELGGGTVANAGNAAVAVSSTNHWSDVTVSRLSTCAITTDGAGYCWGSNQRGEIGDTAVTVGAKTTKPNLVIAGIQFAQISAGFVHACGIAVSGAAYCWGDNAVGQLGIGFADPDVHPRPLIVSFTQRFIQIAVGGRTTCALTIDNKAMCWGRNTTGQIGDGSVTDRNLPTAVAGALKFKSIAMSSGFAGGTNVPVPSGSTQGGVGHVCALDMAGTPYCWGWNGAGQLGDGTTLNHYTPAVVSGGLTFSTLGLGGSHTCGMKGNEVWCWGSNAVGQLGNGTTIDSPTPVKAR